MEKKEYKLKLKEYKNGVKKNSYEIALFLHNKKKYKKAIKYFEEYITLPNEYKIYEAKKYIADYYYNGLGVKKDIPTAIKMYDDISFIYKEVKPIVIRYYYDIKDYSKIIYSVKEYINKDIAALRFCYEYYKNNNSFSSALPYAEMLVEKTKDEEAIEDIVDYYFKYYSYCSDKIKVKDTLIKYSKKPKAAFKLGQLYFYGIDCDQDYKEAHKYFSLAQKKDYSLATPYMAYFKYNGIEEKQNTKIALRILNNSTEPLAKFFKFKYRLESGETLSYIDYSLFEKNATECGEAAAYLVKLLREKRYKGNVFHTPDRYINIAIGQNIPEGFLERGIVHFEKKEYKEAYEDLMYAYERNVKEASVYLSKLLKDGLGCKKNTKKAEELLEDSNDINSIYIKGLDLLKENKTKEGIELLISIMDEHQEAKYEVATRYIYKSKTKKEQEYGYKLLSQLDNRISKYNYTLIKCTYYGQGTKIDYDKFAKLINQYIKISRYDKEKLDKELDYIVGEAYYKGNGLVKSNENALKYLGYSKAAKYQPAIELYNEVEKIVKELTAIEEEKRRKAEEEKRKKAEEQKAIEAAKKAIFDALFKKYKDYRISIPDVKSIYRGYGNLSFTHEVNEYEKTSSIVVRGTMNYFIYLSENDKKNIAQNIFDYIKPYVDEFFKKYPDYPMQISIKHEFTIWHDC